MIKWMVVFSILVSTGLGCDTDWIALHHPEGTSNIKPAPADLDPDGELMRTLIWILEQCGVCEFSRSDIQGYSFRFDGEMLSTGLFYDLTIMEAERKILDKINTE